MCKVCLYSLFDYCPAGMCSNRGLCGGSSSSSSRPNRASSSDGNSSGAHYALCALGVGLIALGIVMIVWTVIPMDGEGSGGSTTTTRNSTTVPNDGEDDDNPIDSNKSSTVAMVLVGVGAVLLLLSICLGVRSKRRAHNATNVPAGTGVALMDHVAGQQEEP